jgi:hypothetical protein
MTTIYFDIETLPAEESSREKLRYIFDKKKAKKAKGKKPEDDNLEETDSSKSFEDYYLKTSFDGGFGRVLCIAYALNDEPTEVLCNDGNENKTLEQFWDIAKSCSLFVGHNIMDFDLRFIYQRSIVLGVKPSLLNLSFARYRSSPIYDTMKEWTKWDTMNKVGLEHIALALGIPSPKDGIDGSQVFNFYKAGKIDDICRYCKRDVDTTRAVYKRMVFES